ncbi:MAG: S1-like domain-containing RNA-binding protein [Bacteroidota bacterium]
MPDAGKIVNIPVQRIEREISYLDYRGLDVPLELGELPVNAQEGDLVEVFIDVASEEEFRATTNLPTVEVGKVARVRIHHMHNELAFADVGLREDLVVPPDQQLFPLRHGQFCHVTLIYDSAQHQLYLSTKLDDLIVKDTSGYKINDQVEIDVWMMDRKGSKVIVNGERWGFLPSTEYVFNVKKGDHLKARIKDIKPNNLILSLQEEESVRLEKAKERILDFLDQHNGYVRLNDKTPPDEIQLRLRMSKKTFKSAVGMLMKDGKVKQTPRAIKLVNREA